MSNTPIIACEYFQWQFLSESDCDMKCARPLTHGPNARHMVPFPLGVHEPLDFQEDGLILSKALQGFLIELSCRNKSVQPALCTTAEASDMLQGSQAPHLRGECNPTRAEEQEVWRLPRQRGDLSALGDLDQFDSNLPPWASYLLRPCPPFSMPL